MPPLSLPASLLTGPSLLLALALGVAFIVVATTRFKLHPFLALIITAYALGLAAGLTPAATMSALTGGFGKTIATIGIVIACGCIVGSVLEKSGCAVVMAETVLKLIGRQRSVLAMSCTGAVVSIPVFCDSGYVILSSLNRSLARQTGQSLAAFAVALSMGLYSTHCLVPPTPGPIATAGELGADIGKVIVLGLLVAVPVVLTTYAYARFVGSRVFVDPARHNGSAASPTPPAMPRPGALAAFAPIVLPVLLIALKSVADLPDRPFGDGAWRAALATLGDPNTAIVLGVFLAWFVVRRAGREVFGAWCGDGLRDAGTIILITAAGGALGGVLRETAMAQFVGDSVAALDLGRWSILLPFLIAAGLKTALGSSTVAMITTASLVGHLLPSMGLAAGFGPVLTTLAVASGAMMVSHVNDSYFWVISQMSGLTVSQGYRLVTVGSAIAGVTGVAVVLTLSLVLL
ncbi:GntP family permease [Opitutus terrae]|uniref:Gluconate transporter n=1 Tax=Opitutus terrae (strain DSM 11246 / JCM 15787 / PB90-1) TaxID=452637 RepID=B1ZNV0_OPITP|nr:GntP family permease [Opitutus terrae]ACB75470.1 Gluconate transporter [Opitutus terrae PB90-1]